MEALGAEGLTALSLSLYVERVGGQQAAQAAADAAMAGMATLVARLPALHDLTVHARCDTRPCPLVYDFRAVHAALSRLVFTNSNTDSHEPEVRLSPTLAASLQVLALNDSNGYQVRPPGCFRNAGDALTRLTRLDCGFCRLRDPTIDLSAWGNAAEYMLPALRFLTVRSWQSFTVDGQGGRVGPSAQYWAAGVLRTLPCLERLTVMKKYVSSARHLRPLFVCRLWDDEALCEACEHRESGLACAGARAVEKAVMKDLPAAGAAAGRRLAVRVMDERDIRTEGVIPSRECTLLGYKRA